MKEDEEELLERAVLTRVVRLELLVTGVTTSVLFGLALFLPTIFLVLKGGQVVGPHLGLLSQFLPGYDVTVVGSIIGLAYGLVLGFALGAIVTIVYNKVAGYREARSERRKRH
jgi:flagellar biosynthesis protein FliR